MLAAHGRLVTATMLDEYVKDVNAVSGFIPKMVDEALPLVVCDYYPRCFVKSFGIELQAKCRRCILQYRYGEFL